jgi:2-iminoacetate synthase ThiH
MFWLQVGTFTLFQETYHKPTFAKMHISGPKSDFNHRLLTQDRAFRGGIDDVGIGTLFGLYDYRWAVFVTNAFVTWSLSRVLPVHVMMCLCWR